MTTHNLQDAVLVHPINLSTLHSKRKDHFAVQVLDRTSGEHCAYINLDGKTAFAIALRARKGANPSLVIQVWHGTKKSGNAVARYAGSHPDYKGTTRHSSYPF